MEKQKQALIYLLSAVAILATAMVLFYYFSDRMRTTDSNIDLNEKVESPVYEKSEFVGVYSPADGALEAGNKRIAYFTVNQREEGGYLGTAKVDTIGGEESEYFPCVDVKIEESEFFLNCMHETGGSISLNGTWVKNSTGAPVVTGKVMWSQNSNSLLEVQRTFQYMPGE